MIRPVLRSVATGTAIGIPFKSSFSWSNWFNHNTNFWSKGRSLLILPDDYGNDASILPAYINVNPTNYLLASVVNYQIADASGFVEAYVYVDANSFMVFASGDASTNTQYLRFGIATSKPYISIRAGATFSNVFYANSALSEGWHKIKWLSTGAAYQIWVDDIQVASGATGGADDGKWFDQVPTYRDSIGIGYCKNGTPVTSVDGKVAWVNYNNKNKWYLTGQGKYEFDNIGTQDLYWVGTALPLYGSQGSTFLLDNGYTVWTKIGELDEYMPNTALNTRREAASVFLTAAVYTRSADINGSSSNHNAAPSMIDFTVSALDNFDRSNTTIFSALARAGADYNAGTPYRWRIQDISSPNGYYTWKNAGHQWRQFSKVDSEDEIILLLEEIISIINEPSSSGIEYIINYCGIDEYFA